MLFDISLKQRSHILCDIPIRRPPRTTQRNSGVIVGEEQREKKVVERTRGKKAKKIEKFDEREKIGKKGRKRKIEGKKETKHTLGGIQVTPSSQH